MHHRRPLIAGLLVAFMLWPGLVPAAANDDPDILFAASPGDRLAYAVSYWRGGSVGGRPTPVTVIRYNLDVGIKTADGERIVATVENRSVDVSIDGSRVLDPPDFDSLFYLAADGLALDVTLTPDGIVDSVEDWERVRAELTARAIAKAGDNRSLRLAAETFLAGLSAGGAAELLARPMALAAPGRIVKLAAPDRRLVDAKGVALPSFTTNARANWSFSLLDGPAASRHRDAMRIEWLGVPDTAELRTIIAAIAGQLESIEPGSAPAMAMLEKDARMWQRFTADYAGGTGQLIELTGQMELRAGPILRKVAIEALPRAP